MFSEIPFKKCFGFTLLKFTNYLPPYFFSTDTLVPFIQSGQKVINIKILLVDDHRLVRKWVRKTIENQNGMEVVGEAANGMEAIKLARKKSPDIILMDVNMPGIDGIETTRRITADMPKTRIIGLSTNDEDKIVKEMKNAGASAYITKTDAFDLLVATIREIASDIRIS